jgi:1-acyl-sn-glycerol-3-phosphate acyltransferase
MSFYRACWIFARGLCAFLFRLKVEGGTHVPVTGGLILACNHASYADPVFIGVATGRELFYLTKREVFPVPVLGWLIHKLNALPIDRSRGDRRALTTVEKRLKGGGAMFLSPEGTRNKTGKLLSPKAGVGMLAYRASVPIVPVCILGTANIWGSLIGLSRVVVRFGHPIRIDQGQYNGSRKEAYQAISNEVMHQIQELNQAHRQAGSVVPESATK